MKFGRSAPVCMFFADWSGPLLVAHVRKYHSAACPSAQATNPTALKTAEIPQNFGYSKCNRVNHQNFNDCPIFYNTVDKEPSGAYI